MYFEIALKQTQLFQTKERKKKGKKGLQESFVYDLKSISFFRFWGLKENFTDKNCERFILRLLTKFQL